MTTRLLREISQERGNNLDSLALRIRQPGRVLVQPLDGLVFEVTERIVVVGFAHAVDKDRLAARR